MLTTLALLALSAGPIDQAADALADFRPEDAVRLLEEAKTSGPYAYRDHVRLYEQLGIAYAYLERTEEAVAAFRTMLALDRARAISYTLSPKVTFLFEKARRAAEEAPVPSVDLDWSRDLRVQDPVEVAVEVLADPEGFLEQGELHFRLEGRPEFETRAVELPAPGPQVARVSLPAVASGADGPRTLELYLVAKDGRGNEVLRYGSAKRPRLVALSYEPPEPWYGRWWIWAIAGVVVAASAGTAVAVASQDEPLTVDGTFRVER